jgi:hypothetical protein
MTIILKEETTPTNTTNQGKIYMKSDKKLYFLDEDGNEKKLGEISSPMIYDDDLVEVWNDFEDYTDTEDFKSDTTNWDLTENAPAYHTAEATIISGSLGSGGNKLLQLEIDNGQYYSSNIVLKTKTLEANKHTFFNILVIPETREAQIKFGSTTILNQGSQRGSDSIPFQIQIFAKGNNEYDAYVGYRKYTITTTDPQLTFYIQSNSHETGKLQIDNIKQSITSY